LAKAKFEKGAIGVLHQHYHSQVTYVESGEFEMTIGDEIRILKGGDSFYIPTNVMHGCVCTSPGVLIDVFSPARENENKRFKMVDSRLSCIGNGHQLHR